MFIVDNILQYSDRESASVIDRKGELRIQTTFSTISHHPAISLVWKTIFSDCSAHSN